MSLKTGPQRTIQGPSSSSPLPPYLKEVDSSQSLPMPREKDFNFFGGRRALITGLTGQDGAYLSKLLSEKNYDVHGVVRRNSTNNMERLDKLDIKGKVSLHEGDLTEYESLWKIINEVRPHEIYNLGAMSFVADSFIIPVTTTNIIAMGTLNLLEAIRHVNSDSYNPKIYQASSSEIFGEAFEVPQTEYTRFNPRSPYGCAKAFAHHICVNYRKAYDMFISCGILFNHESPLRGEEFVTRKIVKNLTRIAKQLEDKSYSPFKDVLELGNVEAERDWGHAKDYVKAMWLMLQQEKPDDFIIASGLTMKIRDFLKVVFEKMDWDVDFYGYGKDFYVQDAKTGNLIVKCSEKFYRPSEVDILLGLPIKARSHLGWEPEYNVHSLIEDMIESEI